MATETNIIRVEDASRTRGTQQQMASGEGVSVLGLTRVLQLVTAGGALTIVATNGSQGWVIGGATVTALAAIGGIVALEWLRRRVPVRGQLFFSPHSAWERSVAELNAIFDNAGSVVNDTYRVWVKNRLDMLAGELGALGKRELHSEDRGANRVIEDLLDSCTSACALLTPEVAQSQLRNRSPRLEKIISEKTSPASPQGGIRILIVHRREDDEGMIARLCAEWARLGVHVETLNIDEARSVMPSAGRGDSVWLLDKERHEREVVFELYNQANGYLAVKAYFERNDKTQAVKHQWQLYSEYSRPFTQELSETDPATIPHRLAC